MDSVHPHTVARSRSGLLTLTLCGGVGVGVGGHGCCSSAIDRPWQRLWWRQLLPQKPVRFEDCDVRSRLSVRGAHKGNKGSSVGVCVSVRSRGRWFWVQLANSESEVVQPCHVCARGVWCGASQWVPAGGVHHTTPRRHASHNDLTHSWRPIGCMHHTGRLVTVCSLLTHNPNHPLHPQTHRRKQAARATSRKQHGQRIEDSRARIPSSRLPPARVSCMQ